MTTSQFNEFFEKLNKEEFSSYWHTHTSTDTAKHYNLRDYREANKIAKLLNLQRTEDENLVLKQNMIEKCRLASSGENNPMYGKSAMAGRHHKIESKNKMSTTKLNKSAEEKAQIKNKVEQTNLEKFGVLYPAQCDECKEKARLHFLEKYGVENPWQAEEVQEKIKQTNIEKYGVENPSQNEDIKLKKSNTMFLNYNKHHTTFRYLFNNIKFDSSWELMYYIYLTDLNINFEYKPKIRFEYIYNNEKHYYYPDFKVNNNYFEIKGDQFFDKDGKLYNPYSDNQDKTIAKEQCMIKNNITILKSQDLIECFNYIENKYSKNYCNQFKII